MFARFHWTREGLILAAVAISVSTYFAVIQGEAFLRNYPDVYGWSELMLSYGGGFVRRGLLGEIAYQLHPFVDARLFLTWLMVVLYALVYAAIILVICGNLNLGSWLFLLSPGALLFTVNDLGAFARKDIVLLGAFLLSLLAIRSMKGGAALAVTMMLYVIATLTHETALAYFPMAVAFLLNTHGQQRSGLWSQMVIATSAAFTLALAGIIYIYRGAPERIALMVERWQERIPSAFDPAYAAEYLGRGVGGNFMAVLNDALYPPTIAGYAAAAVLLFVPIAAFAAYRPPQLSQSKLHRLALIAALLALLTPGLLASDWGRYLYMAGLHVFLFLACMASPRDHEPAPRLTLPRNAQDAATLSLWIMLSVCYAGMWRILHWAHQVSALHRGFLFDLIDNIGKAQ